MLRGKLNKTNIFIIEHNEYFFHINAPFTTGCYRLLPHQSLLVIQWLSKSAQHPGTERQHLHNSNVQRSKQLRCIYTKDSTQNIRLYGSLARYAHDLLIIPHHELDSYHVTREARQGVDAAQGAFPHFLFGCDEGEHFHSITSRPPQRQLNRSDSNGANMPLNKSVKWCTIAGLMVRASRRVKRASSCVVRAGGGSMSSG